VSPRTLRRDIDRLRELGYPVQASAEWTAATSWPRAPPAALMVDDTEAVALAIGLQAAAQGAVEDIAESSVRALAKVVQIMPARLRRRVEALGAMTVPASWGSAGQPSVDPGVLTTVALACRDGERLRFSYTAADGQHTGRTSNHTAWSCSAAAGTWSDTTSPGTTGAASARPPHRTARDRVAVPPRELPAADAAAFVRPASTTCSPSTTWRCSSSSGRDRTPADRPMGFGRGRRRHPLPGPHDRRLTGLATMALGAVGADFRVVSRPN